MISEPQRTRSELFQHLGPRLLAALAGSLLAATWFRCVGIGRGVGRVLAGLWAGLSGGAPAPTLTTVGPILLSGLALALLLILRGEERRGPRRDGGPGAALHDAPCWFFVIGALAVSAVFILTRMAARARYPLDLLLWSESNFLQDMIKLHKGLPPYLPVRDNNSFVYNPGAPLVTWAIATACGRYRDLTFCRWLQIGFSLLACATSWVAARHLSRPASSVGPDPRADRLPASPMLVGLFLFLVVAVINPVTAPFVDLLHNDALALLTSACGLMVLALRGRIAPRRWLLLAAPVPALAVLMKQTGSVVWVGLVAGLWIQERRPRPALRFGLISGALISALALCLTVWSDGWWSFWTARVLAKQVMNWNIGTWVDGWAIPPLVPLALACLGVLIWAARQWADERARVLLSALLYAGLLAGSAAVTSFKTGTAGSNHWGPACLALATLTAAALWILVREARGWRAGRCVNAGAAAALLLAAASLHRIPRIIPSPEAYLYAAHLNAAFAAKDPARTLLDHGTLPYLLRDILPRDRCNPVLETAAGGLSAVDHTVERILTQKYDRILIHDGYGFDWYGQAVLEAILRAYELKERLPGKSICVPWDLCEFLMTDVLVYEPRPLPPADQRLALINFTEPGAYTTTGRAPKEVRIKFSHPMDAATITAASVRLLALHREGGAPRARPFPASGVRYDPGSTTAVITLPAALQRGLYWVMVTDAVRDQRGGHVANTPYRVPFRIAWFVRK